MAAVRIDDKAFADARFAMLAKLMGLSEPDHAIIKVARIWQMQTENYTPQRPTYVVHADIVAATLGPKGADYLLLVGLAEESTDGLYMKGTRGRIEWLWNKKASASAAGKASGESRRNRTDVERTLNGSSTAVERTLNGCSTDAQRNGNETSTDANALTLTLSHGSYEPFTLAPSPQGKRARAKPKKPSVPLPAEWQPRADHFQLAAEVGVDAAAEAVRFRTDCEAKGRVYVNHDAAFSNWLRSPYQKNKMPAAGKPARFGEAPIDYAALGTPGTRAL